VNDLALLVLFATFAGILARQLLLRGPPVWGILGLGALAMVAVGGISPEGAGAVLRFDLPVLILLFALFVFAAALQQAGAIDHLAHWLVDRARDPTDLPFLIFLGFGALSAILLNDALVLVGVPVLVAAARRARVAPQPLLLALALSVSVGSAATPFGNPQNLLISLQSGIATPFATFLRYLALPTAVNLVVGGAYLRWYFPGARLGPPGEGTRPRSPRVPLVPAGSLRRALRRSPVVVLFPLTLAAVVGSEIGPSFGVGPTLPLDLIALVGALVVLLLSPGRVGLLLRVDWTILLLFAALFVVVAGAVQGGLLQLIAAALPLPNPHAPASANLIILLGGLGGSQLVSNVPWVGLQIPVLHALGFDATTPVAWCALAAGSTLAGNVTLLGAASNLIVVQQAERRGVRIGLREFVRVGAPLAVLTVGVLYLFLLVGW
jgi:Na+/H+ antiporter NhaD/arsenite permease-like protein